MHIKRVFCFICCFVKVTLKNKILFSNQESKIFQYLSKGVWWTKTCSNSTIKTLVQYPRHGEKQVKIIIIIKFGTYLYHWIWFIGSIMFDFDMFHLFIDFELRIGLILISIPYFSLPCIPKKLQSGLTRRNWWGGG